MLGVSPLQIQFWAPKFSLTLFVWGGGPEEYTLVYCFYSVMKMKAACSETLMPVSQKTVILITLSLVNSKGLDLYCLIFCYL